MTDYRYYQHITYCTCGYSHPGNPINTDVVRFISRYREETDYCVSGKRVSITDAGGSQNATVTDITRIWLFELNNYANYLQLRAPWRAEDKGAVKIQPFDFPERVYVSEPSTLKGCAVRFWTFQRQLGL